MKEQLLKDIKNLETTDKHNLMGCSENWYDYAYAISKTFTKEELQEMTDKEIEDLIKLAKTIGEALW
jgi:hypothetical protein